MVNPFYLIQDTYLKKITYLFRMPRPIQDFWADDDKRHYPTFSPANNNKQQL